MNLTPTPLQAAFIDAPTKFTLFGGSRGGGKTFAVIIDWLIHSDAYGRNARGIVFRRELVELDDFLEEAKDILEAAGHVWMEQKKQFKSPQGAILRCRYLDNDKHAGKYQGHQYTRVYIEEIGNFPNEAPVKKLYATLRSKHGVPCRFKATANPGGVGHSWVKMRYIDPAKPGTPFSLDGGKTYSVYIPARLTDNPHLLENDPDYIEMIKQAGSEELVRAWLDGDWDVVIGQYFTEWRRQKHVIPTLELPSSWTVRYRAMDWGSAKPYAVLWFAVANGDQPAGCPVFIPRGALVVYRELYGWNGNPNQGTREYAYDVGVRIREKEEPDRRIIDRNGDLSKVDPSTFATHGGPSIAEELARGGAWFERADNRRTPQSGALAGWDQVRKRLKGEGTNVIEHEEDDVEVVFTPMLYVMDTCVHLIRTLPTLPADPDHLDDVDSSGEDHAADALRYGCMARPYSPPKPPGPLKKLPGNVKSLVEFTMDDAWQCALPTRDNVIPRN